MTTKREDMTHPGGSPAEPFRFLGFDLPPGDVAHGPRGVPHAYLVGSDIARMAVTFAPAGIENWFAENGSPVTTTDSVPAPFDINAIVAAADAYKLHVAGPPPAA
jgi:hypothetical protein